MKHMTMMYIKDANRKIALETNVILKREMKAKLCDDWFKWIEQAKDGDFAKKAKMIRTGK
jgi:hypothetical protein